MEKITMGAHKVVNTNFPPFRMDIADLILIVLITLFILPAAPRSLDAAAPRRIISLAPSLTRGMYDLGAQDALVGVTSHRPESASSKDVVGTLTRLNFEKILSLQPDLILASKDSNRIIDIKRLKQLGLDVSVFEGCESFACMCMEFVHLGELIGKRSVAEHRVQLLNSELDHLQSSISERPLQSVFYQMGAKPLITVSDATFTGELILRAGGMNIFGDLPTKYPRVNIEEVVRRNPDIIIVVVHMDPGQQSPLWDGLRTISAVRHKRIYFLEADRVCQPTPTAFLEAYKAVLTILHPQTP